MEVHDAIPHCRGTGSTPVKPHVHSRAVVRTESQAQWLTMSQDKWCVAKCGMLWCKPSGHSVLLEVLQR